VHFAPGVAAVLIATRLAAMAPATAAEPHVPGEPSIRDNSFLVEEAYNQEAGVVQHINSFVRERGTENWIDTFTQEWPVPGMRHQLSWTLLFVEPGDPGGPGWGDIGLNYRFMAIGTGGGPVAFAPRVSLFFPTGSSDDGRGDGGPAAQVNLPLSLELGSRVAAHTNLGFLHVEKARNEAGDHADLDAVWFGQSLIWLLRPRFNLMLEGLWTRSESVVADGESDARTSLLLSPGARFAFNRPSGLQIVPGIAFPFELRRGESDGALLLYLSFEHPFGSAAYRPGVTRSARPRSDRRARRAGREWRRRQAPPNRGRSAPWRRSRDRAP
jgi:hypothetical protein